ncbi:hypothetical protein FQR65_LT19209 [Abscondita terminalis]|nr:hypothetical protein FQR65_LT19209 [Abscondita terminalis]
MDVALCGVIFNIPLLILTNYSKEKSMSEITPELPVEELPKLYAGKYKSVEELEKAYKNSAKSLKAIICPDVSLPETMLHEIEGLAKAADLSQEQFNKTLYAMADQQNQYQTQLENKKKTLGNKLSLVQDYVTKNYPTSLQSTVLNTIIRDENAITEALRHRDQLLNSQVPGLSNQHANLSDPYDNQQEMLKAAKEYEKNPNTKNRKKLINLAQQVAEARVKE